jgi:hypothetical protein
MNSLRSKTLGLLAVALVTLGGAIIAPQMVGKAHAAEDVKAKMVAAALKYAKPALDAGCTYRADWGTGSGVLTLNLQLFNPDGTPACYSAYRQFGPTAMAMNSRVKVQVYTSNPRKAYVITSFAVKDKGYYRMYTVKI